MTEHKAGSELDVYEKWANETHDMWMRRVDVFVAEKVMGIRIQDGNPCSHAGCLSHVSHPCEGCGRWHPSLIPRYSTQIADAWLVLKKVTETKQLSIWTKSNGKISISNTTSEMLPLWGWDFTDEFFSVHEEAPLAICLAALKAVGHE